MSSSDTKDIDSDTETEHAGYFGKDTPVVDDPVDDVPDTPQPVEPVAVAFDGGGDGGVDDDRHMGHLDPGHVHGPTDSQYFTIFWVLFAITALEVSTYFWEDWFGVAHIVRWSAVTVLLILMVVKFVMIAGYFMHLRFDSAMLRRTFTFGLIVALAVYVAALTSMNVWDDHGNPFFNDPPPAAVPPAPDAAG